VFYWLLKWVFIGPVLKVIFRPYAEGTENVPETGGAILASNHLSYSDWLFMPVTIPRRVTFVAKAEYFTTPGIKGWLQKTFFSGAGQVPLDRSGGRASEGAIRTGLRILAAGDLFGIYPEGTRSHDGRLYRGKTGIARMALEAKVPVIPIAVIGTDIVAPPGRIYGRYTRPHVRFGKPLDFSRYEGMESDRYVLRSITDEIMYEIMQLSGQEYVDTYASKAKEEAQREAKAASAAAKAEARAAKEAKAHPESGSDPSGVVVEESPRAVVADDMELAAGADSDPASVEIDANPDSDI
jgi:1-acyl-sn-glycerol-3-phosphate acyltransferase